MQDHTNDPVWKQAIAGSQMLLVAFGALVLMPLITGLDPNVALFTAGLGTLAWHRLQFTWPPAVRVTAPTS